MPSGIIQFDEFVLNFDRFELLRSGRPLKLERIPMELLILLVAKNGSLVTRQEIIDRVWGPDVFLDTEHGINTAIRKIRNALHDDPEQPRFLQTITGKGYRFIAPIATISPASGNGSPGSGGPTSTGIPRPGTRTVEPDEEKANREVRLVKSGKPASRSSMVAMIALVSVLALMFASVLYFGLRDKRSASSTNANHVMLAVLPFENLSGTPNEDYFTDGLTEEIIAQLGELSPDQLGVIARTTSMAYKHTSKSVQQIARELGVDYILESSVRRDGDQVRITVQLIRTGDQVHVWANSYDRNVSHSIAVQEEVAKAVAEQIRIKLNPGYGDPAKPHPLDPQANEAYLRGRYFGNQFTVEGYRKAITYFQQALDRDHNFAEAYSGLADSYYFLVVTDAMSPQEGESKALSAARQAVALGEGHAESHSALCSVMLGLWDWPEAERECKRAVALDPSYSAEHRIYAALLTTLKRHDEAREQISQAMRTDPLSLPNNAEVVRTLYYARDYDQAVAEAEKALQLNPDYYRIHFWLARVYAQKRMYKDAIAESEKVSQSMPDGNVALTELAYSLAMGGREAEARKILHDLEEKSKHDFVPAYNLAIIHIALHENEIALQYLQKAYEERDWAMMVLAVEPRLDPLRGSPAFQGLLEKVRLS